MLQHLISDGVLLLATKILTRPFFAQSVEAPPLEDHVEAVELQLPEISGTGCHQVEASTLAGPVTTTLRVIHWHSPTAPTLVWHHGGGERPFDRTISRMYPPDEPCDMNVIAVMAPFQSTRTEANERFSRLHDYLTMLAVPIRLTELLFTASPLCRSQCRIMSGYSVGGIIGNRHRVIHGSADLYLPFMAGTRHADIFLRAVHIGPIARSNSDYLAERLNFDVDWAACQPRNVFPVLGRWDLLNRLQTQQASYGRTLCEIWPGGHLYGAGRPHLLRQKIEKHLQLFLGSR